MEGIRAIVALSVELSDRERVSDGSSLWHSLLLSTLQLPLPSCCTLSYAVPLIFSAVSAPGAALQTQRSTVVGAEDGAAPVAPCANR